MTATRYLERLYRGGASKPGLSRVRALLSRLDHPQHKIKCVHVAGTNGKGSTCAFLESILSSSGYQTGAFLSPHLYSIREHIMLGGEVIAGDLFEEYAARIVNECIAIENSGGDAPTFFEAMAALAFYTFFIEGVDIAVIETGLGGTHDATNIIDPLLSVITPIGFDHMEYLGNRIEQIAAHKAGIIKPGKPVVLAQQEHAAAHAAVLDRADALGSRIANAADCNVRLESSSLCGIAFSMDCTAQRQRYQTSLPGGHQAANAATAVLAASILGELGFPQINQSGISEGLSAAKWPGRLEVVRGDVNFLLDGAHNLQGAKALAEFMAEQLPDEKIVLVCGMLGSKDARGIASQFTRFAGEVVLTTPDHALAQNPYALRDLFVSLGVTVHVQEKAEDAVQMAAQFAGKGGWVVVSGSLYLMGAARGMLQSICACYSDRKSV